MENGATAAAQGTVAGSGDDRGEPDRRGPWWGPGFDVVRRGYDRDQVEEVLDRAEAELRIVTADRDAMVRAEASAQAEVRALRAEVDRLATSPIRLDGMSARVGHLLRLAQEEADQIREQATAQGRALCVEAHDRARATVDGAAARAAAILDDAEQRSRSRLTEAAEQSAVIQAEAEQQARQMRRVGEQALADFERRQEDLETEQRELVDRTRAEVDRLERAAAAERLGRDEASQTRRRQVEQDFETALADRRTQAAAALTSAEDRRRRAEERCRAVDDEAERRIEAAHAAEADLEALRRRVLGQLAELKRLLVDPVLIDEPAPVDGPHADGPAPVACVDQGAA